MNGFLKFLEEQGGQNCLVGWMASYLKVNGVHPGFDLDYKSLKAKIEEFENGKHS